jgi:cytoskeletal protein CcmA (bactofilin family)
MEDVMWSERKPTRPIENANAGGHPHRATEGIVSVANLTVIGQAMVVRGRITSTESLHVEGEVDGTLELPGARLTIGPPAKVRANATAREIEVMGTLAGDLVASKKITIRKGGRLIGDLRTPGIVIEEGAYFKGKIEIFNPEEPEVESAQEPSVTRAASAT